MYSPKPVGQIVAVGLFLSIINTVSEAVH
jgi:hypothetical protein